MLVHETWPSDCIIFLHWLPILQKSHSSFEQQCLCNVINLGSQWRNTASVEQLYRYFFTILKLSIFFTMWTLPKYLYMSMHHRLSIMLYIILSKLSNIKSKNKISHIWPWVEFITPAAVLHYLGGLGQLENRNCLELMASSWHIHTPLGYSLPTTDIWLLY